jgi:hypothetical protein
MLVEVELWHLPGDVRCIGIWGSRDFDRQDICAQDGASLEGSLMAVASRCGVCGLIEKCRADIGIVSSIMNTWCVEGHIILRCLFI